MEYWELPGLIERYNTDYQNQLQKYYYNPGGSTGLTKDQMSALAADLRAEADELENDADDLKNDSSTRSEYKEYRTNMHALRAYAQQLEDTLILVTADHGHIDTKYAVLQEYPKICECLIRLPSLEPRVLNFFIKEGKKELFKAEFQKEFGGEFLLMPVEEAIEKKLFGAGKPHKHFRSMLGDYLAIATGTLSIYFKEERWLTMHGSLTEEEMRIPLIAFDT